MGTLPFSKYPACKPFEIWKSIFPCLNEIKLDFVQAKIFIDSADEVVRRLIASATAPVFGDSLFCWGK